MSIPTDLARTGSADKLLRPVVFWICSVALLTSEILFLTVRHDAGFLIGQQGWLAWALVRSPMVAQLVIAVVAAAALLLVGSRPWEVLLEASGLLQPPRHWSILLLTHVVIYTAFVCLTSSVLGGRALSPQPTAGLVFAWGTLGLATLASWGAAIVPISSWLRLMTECGRPLLAGAAVGGAAWGVGQFTAGLWRPLGWWTLWIVHGILGLVSREAFFIPEEMVVGVGPYGLIIAPMCSGYEGIGLILTFTGAYLWLFRASLRFPQAFLLLPLGAAIIWVSNAFRIATLILIGAWWSPEIAGGGVHSQAGWLAFNAIALGLVAASRRLRFFDRPAPDLDVRVVDGPNPAAMYLAPLAAVVLASMVAGAFTIGFDWLYPLRVLAGGSVLWIYWKGRFGRWWRDLSWAGVAVGFGVFALWMALEPTPSPGAAGNLPAASALASASRVWAAIWLVFRVFGSVVTVPIVEELAFRGYLTRRLIAAEFQDVPPGRFTWFSFLASSSLFGALHTRWLAGTLAGMLYAMVLYRRGKVADAAMAHAVTNALIAAYVLATGNWNLWS